jgi:hypothetical protein
MAQQKQREQQEDRPQDEVQFGVVAIQAAHAGLYPGKRASTQVWDTRTGGLIDA